MPAPGADGGALPAGCLSPCHGFGGIVEQWKTSTHFSAYVSNLGGEEVSTWTGAQACGNCHAIDAIEQRVAGNVATKPGASVTNLASGQLSFRAPPATTSASEATYAGVAKVAAVTCVTCHAVTKENDPHVTNKSYAKGAFPLRVPAGANDQARLEKSPDTSAVTGTPAGKLGPSNACVWCHKSRKDVTNYITASNSIANVRFGPHEGPQADVYSGAGGYHYAGKTYSSSTHQTKVACMDCHMPTVTTNSGYANHSFYAQIAACTSCHAGTKTFDVAGGQSTIKAALRELEAALNDAGYLTRATTAPYEGLTAAQLADGDFKADLSRPGGAPLTADQAGALYNYMIVARGGALGVHNPIYTKQLLFDSYVALTGNAPTSITRP